MSAMLVLGSPPSSSSATRAIAASFGAFSERSDALPYGREALKRLGGVEQVNEKAVNAADAFIIERYLAHLTTILNSFSLVVILFLSLQNVCDCHNSSLGMLSFYISATLVDPTELLFLWASHPRR